MIKSPEYASQVEVNYIADLVGAGSEALYSPTGYNAEGKHYSEYFDVDSLAAAYMLQELSMNYDAGFSSFYAFKPADDTRLHFGPIWDMDNAFGSPYTHFNVPLLSTELWWVNQMAYYGLPSILAAANRHPEFRALVQERWTALRTGGAFEAVDGRIHALADTLEQSAVMNGLRWKRYGSAAVPEDVRASWQEQAQISMDFVAARSAALHKGFGPEGAYLYYDVKGAAGDWATVNPILTLGETATVRSITGNGKVVPPEGLLFYCWNTEPDNSGTRYFPGDTLLLSEEETVLYAVWMTQAEIDFLNHVVPFDDVSTGKYYYDAVFWAYYHTPQITAGTDEGHFSPGKPCTREQVITFLYAAAGRPGHQLSVSPFTDVKPGKYYYDAVLWAAENGITGGIGDGRFGVGKPCTRQQVVTFLWKAAGAPEPQSSVSPFEDVLPGKYYYDAVLWAAEAHITSGLSQTSFGVGKPCTRAQVVTFLYAAYR